MLGSDGVASESCFDGCVTDAPSPAPAAVSSSSIISSTGACAGVRTRVRGRGCAGAGVGAGARVRWCAGARAQKEAGTHTKGHTQKKQQKTPLSTAHEGCERRLHDWPTRSHICIDARVFHLACARVGKAVFRANSDKLGQTRMKNSDRPDSLGRGRCDRMRGTSTKPLPACRRLLIWRFLSSLDTPEKKKVGK